MANWINGSLNRRSFVQGGTMLAAMGLWTPGYAAVGTATVKTAEGELKGLKTTQGYEFRGVRYAEAQTPANRFKPPIPLKSWTGTRDATKNGVAALQVFGKRPDFGGPFVAGLSEDTPQAEDCLFANVFTPALDGKRPVMFWCHGGGYASGGGTLAIFDGNNLAAYGDVVVVTVNHRLNVFGFALPSENAGYTPNAGMLDLVAALGWVNRNIAKFGGDPNNVTIFGQSGGGGKVSTLLVMPSAKGLFHRAIVESGSTLHENGVSSAVEATAKLAKAINTSPDKLASLPASKLLDGLRISPNGFGPVVDGRTISRSPFDPDAPADIKDIPMMIGSVRTEASYTTDNSLFTLDEQGMQKRLHDMLGNAATPLITEYKRSHPDATPSLIYFLVASDAGARRNATIQAERKSAQNGAPVFLYHFEWKTPVNDIWYTPHAIEIPFVFRNLAQVKSSVGAGAEQNKLSDQVSSAWVSFARTGNPSNKVTGDWAPYDAQKRLTMIFDKQTRVVADPDSADRKAIFSQLGTGALKRA